MGESFRLYKKVVFRQRRKPFYLCAVLVCVTPRMNARLTGLQVSVSRVFAHRPSCVEEDWANFGLGLLRVLSNFFENCVACEVSPNARFTPS